MIEKREVKAFMNDAKVLYQDSGSKQLYIRLSGGFEVCENNKSVLKTKDIDKTIACYNGR